MCRFNRLYAVCVFKESEYYTLVNDVLTELARFITAQSPPPSYAARFHQMDVSVDSLPEPQRALVDKFTDMARSRFALESPRSLVPLPPSRLALN